MKLAIIGGSGVYDPHILLDVHDLTVDTPFGEVDVTVGRYSGQEIVFMARHGRGHSIPPHRINYRANIWALARLGVERIFATTAVGSLNSDMKPGDFVLVDQFIDMTKGRPSTYFEGGDAGVAHLDYTEPYCIEIRKAVRKAAQDNGIAVHFGGCYVCTEGPRFETKAEIAAYHRLGGDLVGMTNVPEVVLARELGICYSTISMVTNFAAGISLKPLSHQEVLDVMAENTEKLKALLKLALPEIPRERQCGCNGHTRPSIEPFKLGGLR